MTIALFVQGPKDRLFIACIVRPSLTPKRWQVFRLSTAKSPLQTVRGILKKRLSSIFIGFSRRGFGRNCRFVRFYCRVFRKETMESGATGLCKLDRVRL